MRSKELDAIRSNKTAWSAPKMCAFLWSGDRECEEGRGELPAGAALVYGEHGGGAWAWAWARPSPSSIANATVT